MLQCLNRLHHRGPDDQYIWYGDHLALGFARLAINGNLSVGRQPYIHGDWVGAINGEIYNYRTLAQDYGLLRSECDTRVVLPLLERKGPQGIIDQLDGFFSAVVIRPSAREVICLRDHMGKKPLFVGRSSGDLFIASELKIFDECDWFEMLPHGASLVDLDTGAIRQTAKHRLHEPNQDIAALLLDAVRKRLPYLSQPVGVFLSGGLDSSIVASAVSRLREDAVYFTLGNPNGSDHQAVTVVKTTLGLRDVRTVPLPLPSEIPELIRKVVHATESYNPSIVSNGIATYLLARAARNAGIKVVLTGEGADELFGGYHRFGENDPWRDVRQQLIDDMQSTELRRLDLCCMAHSIESRCPFLDRSVRAYSDGLGFREMYDGNENKVALRRSFEGVLPSDTLHRRKISFDVGSGIRGMVVRHLRRNDRSERKELKTVWAQFFGNHPNDPYFHEYPVFDAAIDRRIEVHR
jgi:asparagine synthase (glutamine-hydrolysing)